MNEKIIGIIVGLGFLGATIGGFIWINGQLEEKRAEADIPKTDYYTAITGVKARAEDLIKGKSNVSTELPIPTPTADQVGRENAFLGL